MTNAGVNNGNQNVPYLEVRAFIDSSGTGTGGYTLFNIAWNLPAGSNFIDYGIAFVPVDTPPGFYWIFWQLDPNNYISEFNETDNIVYSATSLSIVPW